MKMPRNFVKKLSIAATAAALLSFGSASQAIPISTSSPYNFSWSQSSAAGTLSGSGSITVSGFNSSSLLLSILLNNTSALSTNRLTSFGFGINPNATTVGFGDVSDGGMTNVVLNNIPSLALIEVCTFGGPNCSGGGNGGILGGGSDSFTLNLGGNWGSVVNIDPVGFKYQTGNGSFEFYAPGTSVPEPASLGLLGLGLLGLAFARRNKA